MLIGTDSQLEYAAARLVLAAGQLEHQTNSTPRPCPCPPLQQFIKTKLSVVIGQCDRALG